MDKPDAIISWPDAFDFPLFGEFIHQYRDYFASVIVVFTVTNRGKDKRSLITDKLGEDVTCIDSDPVGSGQDWRDVAIKTGLKYSSAEWVVFLEQDFSLVNPKEFWKTVEYGMKIDCDVICTIVNSRFHPCCWFMKRKALDKTCLDFSPIRDVSDHFSRIQNDAERLDMLVLRIPSEYYHHMAGLTQNLSLYEDGKEITYKPEEFYKYLEKCRGIK